jgi:copper chaperone CopZ
MEKIRLKVSGMHCESCATLITDSLSEIGAKDVKVDVKKGLVEASGLGADKMKAAIEAEGYKVVG